MITSGALEDLGFAWELRGSGVIPYKVWVREDFPEEIYEEGDKFGVYSGNTISEVSLEWITDQL